MIYAEKRGIQELLYESRKLASSSSFGTTVRLNTQEQSSALVGIIENGKIVSWPKGLVLTYCVLQNTYASKNDYDIVCQNMRKATDLRHRTCMKSFPDCHPQN